MKKKSFLFLLSILIIIYKETSAQRPDLGINLSWPVDWNQQHIFADLMKTANGWEELFTNNPVSVDAQGWPLSDGKCSMWFTDSMNGTYKLVFETRVSNSSVNIGATLVGSSTTPVITNIAHPTSTQTTADIIITDAGTHVFTISFQNTNGGVKNVKLMRPLYPGSTSSYAVNTLLTDQFKKVVKPFSTIRYMQFTATNFSQQHTWNDRPQPDIASYNHGPAEYNGKGASWECVINIANELHKDAWINVPLWVDTNYVRQLALLFRDGNEYTGNKGLDPYLHLYIELSNEIWNYEANENHDAAVDEVLNHGDPDHLNYDGLTQQEAWDGWAWAFRRPGAGIVKVSNIFRSVFGNEQMMSRIRPVLCWQQVRHATALEPLSYIEKTQPNPVNYYIYAGGGSAYYSPDLENPGLTLENIWNSNAMDTVWWRDTWPDGQNKCSMMFNSLLCNLYGIKRVAYEGGPSFDPDQPGHNDSVMELAWSDSRMRNEIIEHHNAWDHWDGDLLVYYVLNQGSYGWDFLQTVYDTTHPKYQAIIDLNSTTRQPVTIGNPVGKTIDGNAFQLGRGDWRDEPETGTAWRQNGYWVSYPFNIKENRNYELTVNITTPAGNPCHIDIWADGRPVHTTTLSANVTQDIGPIVFPLSKGLRSIRVNADVEGWIINSVRLDAGTTNIDFPKEGTFKNKLLKNYPNPFNTSTTISFELKESSNVKLAIYDYQGREIITLVNGRKEAGKYDVEWDGKNSSGFQVPSGVYFYQLQYQNGYKEIRKMILLK